MLEGVVSCNSFQMFLCINTNSPITTQSWDLMTLGIKILEHIEEKENANKCILGFSHNVFYPFFTSNFTFSVTFILTYANIWQFDW